MKVIAAEMQGPHISGLKSSPAYRKREPEGYLEGSPTPPAQLPQLPPIPASPPLPLPHPSHLTSPEQTSCLFLSQECTATQEAHMANTRCTLHLPTVSQLFLCMLLFKTFSEILCSLIRLESTNIYLLETYFMRWVYEGYKEMRTTICSHWELTVSP